MKKVAIVGVEGSGKTVMLAGLGDLYTYPDEDGYFLAPKNFGTAAYVAEKIERMRKGEWPSATAGDEMQGLDWTLKRREPGARKPAEKVCEVSFLDFAGEVYRAAYGISDAGDATLKEQVQKLKQYVCGADDLIVLINLRDVITIGLRDKRVQEAMWITKSILDTALGDDAGSSAPRAAIVLSQADSYASTIELCDGALGVLRRYLPHVANDYDWLDIFAVNAVDKTVLDDDGNLVPAADFTTQGLLPILKWVCRGAVSDGGRGATALPGGDLTGRSRLSRPETGGARSCATVTGAVTTMESEHKKVQLWKGGPYWAETNIGAENPWDSGYHFWWGDTVGYKYEKGVWVASDRSAVGFSFEEENTPTWAPNLSALRKEGWVTVLGRRWFTADNALTNKHDAAQVQWGGGWRMPTLQELKDLCTNCLWVWASMNGVRGYIVQGRGKYASASIFLPAAGRGYRPSLCNAGSSGYYWSSVTTSDSNFSWSLDFDGHNYGAQTIGRHNGRSIRPVQGSVE